MKRARKENLPSELEQADSDLNSLNQLDSDNFKADSLGDQERYLYISVSADMETYANGMRNR